MDTDDDARSDDACELAAQAGGGGGGGERIVKDEAKGKSGMREVPATIYEVLPREAWTRGRKTPLQCTGESARRQAAAASQRRGADPRREELLRAKLEAATEPSEKRKLRHSLVERRRREKMRHALDALRAALRELSPDAELGGDAEDDASVVMRAATNLTRVRKLETDLSALRTRLHAGHAQPPSPPPAKRRRATFHSAFELH
mmetsp:Transcript_10961/g.29414  ORF Transcript_10961/g.29414 Transcript_10961/m.29414 type:complete len:204 (+) Transcript_10961:549-1160(+)